MEFKIRISSDEMSNEQLTELRIISGCCRDSMMIQSVSEAAKAKINWLAEHSEEKEILTGFNNMRMDSELYATKEMIRYYKAHENN